MSEWSARADPPDALAERMRALGVRETDLEEQFVRSSGPGGQNVNKTSTCVVLRHRPSGLQVRCQTSRQQGDNRSLARRFLLDKIEAQRRREADLERSLREKARRQKRGRSRGAQERMLADKARQAAKKRLRQKRADD